MPKDVNRQCLDAALRLLKGRAHSTAELRRKLRKRFELEPINAAIAKLEKVGYLTDAKFAEMKAASSVKNKQHGRRRAKLELMKAGVDHETADRALSSVYDQADTLAVARQFAQKQSKRLLKLEPQVARRRLIGALQRRGFDYDDIKPVVEEVLGPDVD